MAATMRGVALIGQALNATVLDLPMPTILNATEAIVRINATAICGSDLHYYHQALGSPEQPFLMGHEAIGYVTEIGDAVTSLEVGQYVVIPDNVDDGHFSYAPDEAISFSGLQGEALQGLQAEYARVPFADNSLIPVPLSHATNQSTLYDYLFLSDIFPTAWSAITFSGFVPGDSVAIFGAGPVGLLAAYSARLRGASRVYSVDMHTSRLQLAADPDTIGAIPVNLNDTPDAPAAILEMEAAYGPDAALGVRRGVDAVGFEAVNVTTGEVDSSIVPRELLRVVAPKGGMGIVGVYGEGLTSFDVGGAFAKGVAVGGHVVLPLEVVSELAPLVQMGMARPGFIVSATIGIEEAPEYYARFDKREETKVVINFAP